MRRLFLASLLVLAGCEKTPTTAMQMSACYTEAMRTVPTADPNRWSLIQEYVPWCMRAKGYALLESRGGCEAPGLSWSHPECYAPEPR